MTDFAHELASHILDAEIRYDEDGVRRLTYCIAEWLNINGYEINDGNWSPWSPPDVEGYLERYIEDGVRRLTYCIAEWLNINGYEINDGNWSPWSPPDVEGYLERYILSRPLEKEEIKEITRRANSKANFGNGVSWGSLEYWIEDGLANLGIEFKFDINWEGEES